MPEVTEVRPSHENKPRLNFIRTLYKHLIDWSAEYSALILTMASVFVMAQLYYLLTGRRPEENLMWLINFSERAIAVALSITFTSMARQAFGVWYRKEELLDRPILAVSNGAKSLVIFLALLYVFTH